MWRHWYGLAQAWGSYPRVRGNGAASVTLASYSLSLLTQHTGRNLLNAEIVESCEGVRCRPARSSADVCQRGTVRQRMGGGNTPGGVSPHPQGARLALGLVRQDDGLHYPVGQPLFGDSLPFLLTSVADKELLRASDAPGAVHVYAQCSYGTHGHLLWGWICLLRGQCLQVHHLIAKGRGGNLGHVSRPGSQDNVRVDRPEHKAVCCCTTENCWAKPSTVSQNSPAWEMGASRKRALSMSFSSARLSQRWRSWTTMVDTAFPRDRAVTFVARRVKTVAVRSSCINPGPVLPSCTCLSVLAWWTCRIAMACKGGGCLVRSAISFGRESGCQLTGLGREMRTVPPSGGISWAHMQVRFVVIALSTWGMPAYPLATSPSRVVRMEEADE